jgi:hypothetical protein
MPRTASTAKAETLTFRIEVEDGACQHREPSEVLDEWK